MIGAVALAGWALDIRILRTLVPGIPHPMVATSAVCFVVSGAALALQGTWGLDRRRRLGADLLTVALMGIALISLGGNLFGWDHGLDRILLQGPGTPSTGEMTLLTSLSFLLIGAALILLRRPDPRTAALARVMIVAVTFIAVFALMGAAYRIESLVNPMPPATAITFLVLCPGLLALARQGSERRMGGWLLRRLLPASAVLIVVLASLTRILNHYFERDLARAIGLVIGLGALAGLVWLAARALDRVDAERRLAVDRLRHEEEEQRAILGSIGDGVVTTDTNGIVVSVNPAMERLAGWKKEEAIGHPYDKVFPLLDRKGRPVPEEERFVARAIASGQILGSQGYDLGLLTRDGTQVPVSISAAPILGPNGETVGGVDIVREVSHEREVDRLKSSLVSTASHELRTPLTMIQGFAELLKTRDLDRSQVQGAAEQIHSSAERLSRLIDDLLSVSRIEAGRLEVRDEPVELEPIISEAVAPFSDGRAIRVDLDGTTPTVRADPDLLHRVLTNLLSNAIKYSPGDTMVTVTVREAGPNVEVAVRDQGVGMSRSEREQLFEKFFRVNRPEVREAGGTGLGLFITKNLVEMQGGEIRVDSEPGQGSTFTFTLPIVAPARVGGGS